MTEKQAKTDAAALGVEIVHCARRWTRLRARLKLALDSKTAPPSQVQRVRVAYNKESYELEKLVVQLERMLLTGGRMVPATRKTAKPFPWNELLNLLAKAGAEGLHGALNGAEVGEGKTPPRKATTRKDDVIDAEIDED